MIGALVAIAIGVFLIVADWRMSTPPDKKTKRRPKLSPTDAKRLRDMALWTVAVAAAVWLVPRLF